MSEALDSDISTMSAYSERYPVGSRVRVANRKHLEAFRRDWQFHNPLELHQLSYAGTRAVVSDIGFYHGGDVLYSLSGVPGVWHEECLMAETSLDLDHVVNILNRFHQRATYGAVGGVVDRPPAFLMSGYPRNHRYSWIVNAESLLPTGYTEEEMHPSLRERELVISSAAELEEWLRNPG